MVFVQSDKYQILWIWHEYGESAQGSNTTSLMMTLEKYNGIWCGDVTRKVASFISNQLYWYTLVTTITCYFCCFWSLFFMQPLRLEPQHRANLLCSSLLTKLYSTEVEAESRRMLLGRQRGFLTRHSLFQWDRQMTIILFRIFSALFLSFFKKQKLSW